MIMVTKILVVDDDAPTREFIVEALEEEGYMVRSAEDATHALAAIQAEQFNLILLDLRMPGIDGADLFRSLYERSLATMPIILMTADNKAMQELVAQGVKYILFKPFNLDTLHQCVAEALRAPQDTQQQGAPIATAQDAAALAGDVHICS